MYFFTMYEKWGKNFLNIQGSDTHGVDSYYLCYDEIIGYRGLLRGLYYF